MCWPAMFLDKISRPAGSSGRRVDPPVNAAQQPGRGGGTQPGSAAINGRLAAGPG